MIELIPFIMPKMSASFTHYIKESIIAPYRSCEIICGIEDHFEIETESIQSDDSHEKKDLFHANDHRSRRNSSESDQPMMGGKEKNKPSSTDQNLSEIQESKPTSRWDSFNARKEHTNVEGRCANDKYGIHQEKATMAANSRHNPSKSIYDSSKLLCQRDIKVQVSSRNPLLANGRGTYVGRHLGNHDFSEVKITHSSNTSLKARRVIRNSCPNTKVINTTIKEEESNRRDAFRRERRNPIPSLGSATSMCRTSPALQKSIYNGKVQSVECHETDAINSGRSGAALLAARVGRYLRTKSRK